MGYVTEYHKPFETTLNDKLVICAHCYYCCSDVYFDKEIWDRHDFIRERPMHGHCAHSKYL
jgi:hypothetical protein